MNNKKGQIWSLDLIFALVIFGFTITIIATSWIKISDEVAISQANSAQLLSIQAKSLADSVLSVGSPTNWYGQINTTNVSTWNGVLPGIYSSSTSGAISPYKLYDLMSMSNYNYRASQSLFGVGYNYYITIGGSNSGSNWKNITIGLNPLVNKATTIYTIQRTATLNGDPVAVDVMIWTNTTGGVS